MVLISLFDRIFTLILPNVFVFLSLEHYLQYIRKQEPSLLAIRVRKGDRYEQ